MIADIGYTIPAETTWSGYHRGLARLIEREDEAAKLLAQGINPKHVWSRLDCGRPRKGVSES